MHYKDLDLLSKIQKYFGVGSITKHGLASVKYRITSFKDLSVLISHCNKYPLITQKRADFELFKQAADIIKVKNHLKDDGFNVILRIRATMNLGLTDALKTAFPHISPVARPIVKGLVVQNPY